MHFFFFVSVVLIIFNGSGSHVETGELLHILFEKESLNCNQSVPISNNVMVT